MDAGGFVVQVVEAISAVIGYDLRPLAPFVGICAAIAVPVITLYFKFKQRMKDLERIRADLNVTAAAITATTQNGLGGLLGRFENLHQRLDDKITGRLDGLQTILQSRVEVTAGGEDHEIIETSEERVAPVSRQTRLKKAENVRNVVMQHWLNGRVLWRSDDDPNVYIFRGKSEAGLHVAIRLLTPYRLELGSDGRLSFALDVWIDNRKHMNFEWDSEGDYALRGFKPGEWFQDVAEWTLKPERRAKKAA